MNKVLDLICRLIDADPITVVTWFLLTIGVVGILAAMICCIFG